MRTASHNQHFLTRPGSRITHLSGLVVERGQVFLPGGFSGAEGHEGDPAGQGAHPLDLPGLAAGLAQVFKALGDPVRLRLVSLIGAHQGGEVCVCDLAAAFDLTQPTISHHLKVLREAGIIDSERRGTWVYYWLVPAALERMSALLSAPGGASAPASGRPGSVSPSGPGG